MHKINKHHSDIPVIDSYRILIHNGSHLHDDSIRQFADGVVAGNMASVAKEYGHLCRDFSSKYNVSDDTPTNTTPNGGGFFLFVPANTKPAKPIQVVNLLGEYNGARIQLRNLVIMEQGSSAELLVCDDTLSDPSCTYNDVTDVALGEAATLDMVRLQKVNGATCLTTNTTVQQAASSRMKTHYVTLSGETVRNSLKVTLAGANAEHIAGGLAWTQQTEHVENDTLIVHESPECRSDQMFRHILSDASTGAFTGRIVVAKNARKTVAYQRCNNILLHPKAKMNIQPQLEIYADDVKCSHGATVGQLSAEALFYLRSRGVGEVEAKKILLQAFAREALNGISCEQVREKIMEIV